MEFSKFIKEELLQEALQAKFEEIRAEYQPE
jgi:hypothetical protein